MSPLLTEFRALSELATSNSAPQHLSNSASQLSVLVSWESLAEVSKGCKVPRPKKKFFVRESRGHPPPLHATSTFGLLGPNAEKMTQIGRCFRISFHRAVDEVRFSTFLIPLMERLIPDRGQLNPFCAKFLDPENCSADLWKINGVPMESMKSKENQLSGKLSAEESGDLSRFFQIPRRISENFRDFPEILENFPELSRFSRISQNSRDFSKKNMRIYDFGGDFP